MKPIKWLCRLGLVALALTPFARADDQAAGTSPYQTIVDRNAFNLKAPPDPIKDTPPPPPPMATVRLTGVTDFGTKRALFEIEEQEPGKPKNVKKPILQEGERDGLVEVVSIDVQHATVKIKNNNFETNLIFEVQKQAAAPAPPPGVPGAPGVGIPGYNPANPAAATPGVYPGGVPRPIPLPGAASAAAGRPNPYGAYGSNPGATGVGITPSGTTPTMPSRYFRVAPPTPGVN